MMWGTRLRHRNNRNGCVPYLLDTRKSAKFPLRSVNLYGSFLIFVPGGIFNSNCSLPRGWLNVNFSIVSVIW